MEGKNQANNSLLCKMCQTFFGNPQAEGMCSSCYKLHHPELSSKPIVYNQFSVKEVQETLQINIEKPKVEKPKQMKCQLCGIKVGYLGFKCKCGYTYCGQHKYCDMHKCTYDYKTEAKERIMKANPAVIPEKLSQV